MIPLPRVSPDEGSTGPLRMLVMLRHGESNWNAEGRFAGWEDIGLTQRGIEQAKAAGVSLRKQRFEFDICCTSVLKRATHTLWHCLSAMDRTWVPTIPTWRLNERHYGALQGLSKQKMAEEFGADQVRQWRRSFSARPPSIGPDEAARLAADPRYAGLEIPVAESLEDTVSRVSTFWRSTILPALSKGDRVLVVAHGTSLRALAKIVCGLNVSEVETLEFANGLPVAFVVDESGISVRRHDIEV